MNFREVPFTFPTLSGFPAMLAALLMLFSWASAPFSVQAQISYGGIPFALETGLKSGPLSQQAVVLPLSAQQEEEKAFFLSYDTPAGESMHAGVAVQAAIHPLTHGTWENHGDTLWLWRALIQSPGASGLGIIMENFHLAPGSRMFIYEPDLGTFIGSFDHRNNNDYNIFSSQLIASEKLIIEYQEPILFSGQQPFEQSSLEVTQLIHIYQGAIDLSNTEKNLGNSGPCMVNINCPEGNPWQRQKRGVARMLMRVGSSFFWCTGSLVNTTMHDGSPYFLTAAHCGDAASPDDMLVWQFYFNFERPECSNFGTPSHNVLYGAYLMSKGPLLQGSDFQLLYLRQTPPPAWRPYYNGWNRLNEPSPYGVGIHHPGGDAKKISTYSAPVTSAGPVVSGQQMAPNSTWRVNWVATQSGHGVSAGGSSGSPLFNPQGLIVGTLTGGSSNCNSPNNPDFYGKISYHWDQSANPYEHIKYFLDPFDTGVTEIFGYDPFMGSFPAPGFVSATSLGEEGVRVSWLKPGQTPNNPGWFSYSHSFTDYAWNGPERATVFHDGAFNFSYPVTVTRLSHTFLQNPSTPWPSNQFRFRVYDHTGYQLMYESPILEATSLVEHIYEMSYPITFENKFYVAVAPVHFSGMPSSVYQLINYGHGVSFNGSPEGGWTVAGNNQHQYAYLTRIYVEDYTEFSGGGTPSDPTFKAVTPKWANSASQYRIFKNDELIHTLVMDQYYPLVFIDDSPSGGAAFDTWHVTAVYPEGVESDPSNKAVLFNEAFCNDMVNTYPWTESFASDELPVCWSLGGEEQGWEITGTANVFDMEIAPQQGNYFMYMHSEAHGNHWLVSPGFDLAGLQRPALAFWFNSSWNDGDQACAPELYISRNGGSFNKFWDAFDHPEFRGSTAMSWIRNVEDLGRFRNEQIRLAFRLGCDQEAFAALDNLEIFDAEGNTFRVMLNMTPANAGEVYGFGRFIPGQKVSVFAAPKGGLYFHNWRINQQVVSSRNPYEFIMPGQEITLTAFFDPAIPASVSTISEENFSVFPNPSQGDIFIRLSEPAAQLQIRVFNTSGKQVASMEPTLTQGTVPVSLQHLPAGLYLMEIISGQQRTIRKISITK